MPGAEPNPADHAADPSDLASTVYAHLRAIAQRQMSTERPGHTLTATALVHEAFLRLGGSDQVHAGTAAEFYRCAAQAMRRILIERARARATVKRGGGTARVPLEAIGDVADLDAPERGDWALAFDHVFQRLEGAEPEVADVVRLRFFAGLTVPQTAAALGISERTVNNRWAFSRAWLARELEREP